VVVRIGKLIAIVLTGAGAAGLLEVVGVEQRPLYIGIVTTLAGGIFMTAATDDSWVLIRRYFRGVWATEGAKELPGIHNTVFRLGAAVGLFGLGIVIGSIVSYDPALIVAGIGGIVAIVIGFWPRTSSDIRAR
jgi:hypothetical protein